MSYDNNNGRELGWDDIIENDGEEFTILPEGDYTFTVTKVERGRSKGSAKMPPCNMAIITMRVEGETGGATVTDNILLHTKTEWKISSFLRAIGVKKHGEPIKPNWLSYIGATGSCHVIVDKFTGTNGNEYESNKIDKYYDATVQPAPQSQPVTNGYW